MNLLFAANILDQHKFDLCLELKKHFSDFCFISTEEARAIGYQMSQSAVFAEHYAKGENDKRIEDAVVRADAVIFGTCPDRLIEQRMKKNKLSFLYSERFFKNNTWRRFIPMTRETIYKRIGQYKDKNMYVLCASAYLPYDLSLIGFPADKCFRWGYFPARSDSGHDALLDVKRQNRRCSILWAGRFLRLKHPEYAIETARRLRADGIDFEMIMLGDGEERERTDRMIASRGLAGHVKTLGSKSSADVRAYMKRADIFLFTSDFKEGWGAVVNESMSEGCAVVASHAAGSVPFLIKNGENGFIFESGNVDELYSIVKRLTSDARLRERIGRAAYESIHSVWNAECAARRLAVLTERVLSEEPIEIYDDGPCSRAEILENHWYPPQGRSM